jgi:hypothetical protein
MCVHCRNRRRIVEKQLAEQGATETYIADYLTTVLCDGHTAEKEERERRERRNARRRKR